MSYAVYILKCSDGSYYTGLTKDLDGYLRDHEIGAHSDSYTFSRRLAKLVWSVVTESYQEAFQWERKKRSESSEEGSINSRRYRWNSRNRNNGTKEKSTK